MKIPKSIQGVFLANLGTPEVTWTRLEREIELLKATL